jgi:hypothetical protein
MRRTPKIAAVAAGLVLVGAAAAAALDAPPPAADVGLDVAEDETGKDLPVRAEGQAEDTDVEDTEVEDGDPDALVPETADTPDAAEHGMTVSALAQATESGPGKGEIVSEVASDGRAGGEAAPDGGIDSAAEASDTSATGQDNAADQADAGSANAGEHTP